MFDVCGENDRSIGKKLFKKPDSLIEVFEVFGFTV